MENCLSKGGIVEGHGPGCLFHRGGLVADRFGDKRMRASMKKSGTDGEGDEFSHASVYQSAALLTGGGAPFILRTCGV